LAITLSMRSATINLPFSQAKECSDFFFGSSPKSRIDLGVSRK
jgi:hypothetical protein